jgi:hypothetical protein
MLAHQRQKFIRHRDTAHEPLPKAHSHARSIAMKFTSILFWGLVLLTAGISYRWGSMIGLIFFVLALMTGAVVVSHLALQ